MYVCSGRALARAWPTIPQLYVNGEFVGGCDIMMVCMRTCVRACVRASLPAEGRIVRAVRAKFKIGWRGRYLVGVSSVDPPHPPTPPFPHSRALRS